MRPAAGTLLIVLLAALAAHAIVLGSADLFAFGPRYALNRPPPKLSPDEAQAAFLRGREQLERAIALDPRNPGHHENLARWHERAAIRLAADALQSEAYLRQSLQPMRRALTLRPGSPYTWMDLAAIKARLGQYDAELSTALVNAARFGPWEPEIQLAAAGLMVDARGRLSPEAMRAARGLAANALKHQADAVFERMYRAGQLDRFCALPGAAATRHALRCI